MLQPKKPNPNQKSKRLNFTKGEKSPASYDVDWDKVRSINDNVVVQAAKMIDPIGITSYPDVYYAGKDLYEGKGSVGNLALNVLGALPMVGKAKVLFNLAKASKASRTVTGAKKIFKGVEKVAEKVNKATNPLNIPSPFKLKNQRTSSKQISKADVKNLALDLLDLGNVGADVTSVGKAATPVVEEVSKVIKKELETPSLIDKKKIIQYYNTDPKRGGVEKPGQLANVQYVPVSNSAELKMWEQQKLAFGTNQDGIMKKGMNPRKKYAAGSNAKGVGPNNYIPSPNEVLSDYNIMLAKADQQVAENSVVPIVALVGGLAQTALGMGKAKSGGDTGNFTVSGDVKDTTNPEFQSPIGDRFKSVANGMNNVNADVEVEGGEMYETPQGETGEFQGPSHEQGGIPMEVNQDIPEGTKVYSDRLTVGKETLAERKANRERQIANLEKTASQPLLDSAVKNAMQRKMAAIQKEEIADLQFQEQVNNMQQMADTVVAAFGTSMAGVQENPVGESMRYGMGTGADGVTEYDLGTSEDGIDPNEIDPITMQQIQTVIGSNPDGTWGRRDRRKARKFLKDKDQTGFPSWVRGGDGITKNQSDMELALGDPDFQKDFRKVYFGESAEPLAQEETLVQTEGAVENPIDTTELAQVQETVEGTTKKVNLPGTMLSRGLNKMGNKIGQKVKKLDEEGMIPGLGDLTGLFGNYLGATSGLKNAAEQRSTDVTHRNVFANAGKESQKQLDNAMNSIEAAKAQAIVKATATTQGGKRAGRNATRSGNVAKTMDWLYDTALNEQIASISAGAAGQVSDIFKSKASTALSADQLRGTGEHQAAMANEAAKDAYYSAKGVGLRDQALGIQNIGKDLNAMKENKIKGNLMKDYGKWFSANASGISNKNNSTQSKGNNLEIPDGKGGTISMTREQFQELMKTINPGKGN
jgi:hypothetical protein